MLYGEKRRALARRFAHGCAGHSNLWSTSCCPRKRLSVGASFDRLKLSASSLQTCPGERISICTFSNFWYSNYGSENFSTEIAIRLPGRANRLRSRLQGRHLSYHLS